MKKNLFNYLAGFCLFAPLSLSVCCDSLYAALFAVAYGIFLWYSPRISPRVRKFWRKFWKANLEVLREFEIRVR